MKVFLQRWWPRLALAALLVLTFWVRLYNREDVFHDRGVYFIEGDCYSRMERAKMVTEGNWIIRHHEFENWPQGTKPHTTAPMDWLIVFGKKVCDVSMAVFDRQAASPLHHQTLDLSGALISPVLAVLTAIWLWWWAGWMRLPYRAAMVFFFAVSPIAVHGTVLGRPDHQSLQMLLLAVAVGAELALADTRISAIHARRWALTAGLAWGLALWVSLFEPAVFFAGAMAWQFFACRTALFARAVRARWWALGGVLLVAVVLDGWRLSLPDGAWREYFAAWSAEIAELKPMQAADFSPVAGSGEGILRTYSMGMIWQWLGAWWLTAPLLLWLAGRRDPRARGLLPLLIVMLVLTAWQRRWGYFVSLAAVMTVPFQLSALRGRALGWAAAALAMLPVLWGWSALVRPNDRRIKEKAQQRATALEYRYVAELMRSPERQPFLAPWWVSPQIAYWSGQPGVAGTSHQSLPGIVDTARFFLAEKPEEAVAVLKARGVHWVVIDDAPIVNSRPARYAPVDNASRILSRPPPEEAMGRKLAEKPRQAPLYLRYLTPAERGMVRRVAIPKDGKFEETSMEFYEPQLLKLYEVLPDKL